MIVRFSEDCQFVVFQHESGIEYKYLHEYPAFLKQGPVFYIPAKINVLYNVLKRLKSNKRLKVRVQKEVQELADSTFSLKPIPESFKYHTTPKDFQDIALRYIYTLGSAGILLDPGMGKSKVILDYIHLMGFKRSFIVCPKPLLFVWEDEIQIHRPELTYYTVKTTDWEKELDGIMSHDITIINYSKVSLLKEQIKKLSVDFMHLDEFLIKSASTDRTKDLTEISKGIPYKAGGSGTLVNNSVLDVFPPIRYLEPALVGYSSANFMSRYTVQVKNKESGRSHVVAYKGIQEVRSILESCCIVMTKDEWLKDMPAKKFHDIHVPMSDAQKEAFSSLARNYMASFGNHTVEIDNPLVMLSKLYQISNGFVYIPEKVETELSEKDLALNNDLEDLLQKSQRTGKKKPKRQTYFFEEQPKVEALRKLVKETLSNKRSILWFNMQAEFELISAMLEEEGIKFLSIKGGDKEIGRKVRLFNKDPSYQLLVCQAKSVNYGITVLGTTIEKMEEEDFEVFPSLAPEVHTQIFYSINFSLEVYLQQQDRIHRLGQTHECNYYRIFASNDIEFKIRDALEDKMSLRKDMLVDIALKIRDSASNLV